jgi:Mn-dependent DtxR family transcriptional regulator
MVQDRSHSDHFHATHQSLASMLGVRRPTVTLLAILFQEKGLISYQRGTVAVLDRNGLEKLSCKCYWANPDRPAQNPDSPRSRIVAM